MKRDYRDYLEDILAAIDESAEFTRDIPFEVFTQDRKTVNAVVCSLEVLGEAARSIPDHLRAKAPDVPWKYMAGMRNKLIHEYFGVDLSIVFGQSSRSNCRPCARKLNICWKSWKKRSGIPRSEADQTGRREERVKLIITKGLSER